MASTYSPNLRIELIGTGDQSGLWGNTTNTNLGSLIEQAITGVASVPMTDANYTLTSLNGSVDEARNAVITMTSGVSLTATRNVIIPNVDKLYTFKNSTTGGQSIVVKTSAGVGITVPNGKTVSLYCNGTDCLTMQDYYASPTIDTPALTGTPTAPTASAGTNTTQIATTAFVQAALQAMYPVGSVYINASSATNPATLLGFGTWVSVGDGKVIVNQDTADTSFDVLGETGGSKDAIVVSHTHTASSSSSSTTSITDPGHFHTVSGATNTAPYGGAGGSGATYTTSVNTDTKTTGITAATTTSTSTTINSTGSSGTNANLPPYVVVKMWKRTA